MNYAAHTNTSGVSESLEQRRLEALRSYNLLDTLPDQELDDITRLASVICQMPISLITLIDTDRQWFKSRYGLAGVDNETPRELSFCAHTIQNPHEILIVPDARQDARFRDNPFTVGEPNVAFYAGIPLVNQDGFALGSLCVIDDQPRTLNDVQLQTLKALARLVVEKFELRRANQELEEKRQKLQESYEDIEAFARVVAHDLKTPVTNMYLISELLLRSPSAQVPEAQQQQRLELLRDSSLAMGRMVDDLLNFAKSSYQQQPLERQDVALDALIDEICKLHSFPPEQMRLVGPLTSCSSYRILLKQILLNLIGNALKHANTSHPQVAISCHEEEGLYEIAVADNGCGMSDETKARAFELFYTAGAGGIAEARGHGIGLATVNTMVKRLGGSVRIDTAPGKGTTVRFTMRK
jgi:signal transduction histidine kinase